VEADGGLVEDVNAAQVGAELRGEPDALALAPRQRVRAPVEAEIAEPDLLEEREPRPDLAQRALRDRALARAEAQRGDDARRIADGQRGEVGEPVTLHANRARARIQPRAVARDAGSSTVKSSRDRWGPPPAPRGTWRQRRALERRAPRPCGQPLDRTIARHACPAAPGAGGASRSGGPDLAPRARRPASVDRDEQRRQVRLDADAAPTRSGRRPAGC
jgi:hypothetical protein